MEWLGVLALLIMLCYSSYPGKVKRLEATIKRLERKQKGENFMSKLISELVNKECEIKSEDGLDLIGNEKMKCFVLDCDDEWIKVRFTDKKNKQVIKLLRIEHIDEIEVIEA